MVYLLAARLFSFPFSLVPTCAGGRGKTHPTRDARPNRVWYRLRESICQRLFPFRYIRIKGGVSARSFLSYSHCDILLLYLYRFCLSFLLPKKFLQRRNMNKRRGFYRTRPLLSQSCDKTYTCLVLKKIIFFDNMNNLPGKMSYLIFKV